MLYYLENANLTEYRICVHSWYKPRTGRRRTFVTHRKLRYFPITPKLQRLLMSQKTTTNRHDTIHLIQWMES